MIASLALAGALAATAADNSQSSAISQDITVRARAGGPTFSVPPPAASRPVVDEILRTLTLGREGTTTGDEIRVSPDTSRFDRPFPAPPFFAMSPRNIRAYYDSWTFEVLAADDTVVFRSEGTGPLRERVDWDGSSSDGRLALSPGRSYRYRFSGRRGAKGFVVLSDPVRIVSFSRREYAGQTRLEAGIDEIFVEGTSAFVKDAERYLDLIADGFRAGEPRSDGTYRMELRLKNPGGEIARARAKALAKKLAAALLVDPARVAIDRLPADRGEALAALLPPSRGDTLRFE